MVDPEILEAMQAVNGTARGYWAFSPRQAAVVAQRIRDEAVAPYRSLLAKLKDEGIVRESTIAGPMLVGTIQAARFSPEELSVWRTIGEGSDRD